ncbi:NAD-dependent epimerase/dehydratase family protein [Cytophagaceae bacterium DM2B3-1]|uniref:NAD-dependent epimerase/dehydratase family protein n=1 Tax=Xanthocytophaga flava TaxID=3048013 RepID=A0ABT7CPW7_9BACT|nr:NAD-dependent epimerase/dehydratase family protein [Xanthocytophaga flavus]MDJ1468716.1 NAD-dependent epimerase/dehydratase family protein [Xanthocytophaga flavus]MDJ1495576.1 NAD-dependent epimerase/dehydratase family protein [Xanthocytophaga flavus]
MRQYKKIVVTGTSGFLGSRVAKFLPTVFIGATILATSRKSDKKLALEQAGCIFIPGDLTDAAFCQQILAGADAVVHCAALSSPWGKREDFEKANVTVTQNLLQAAIAEKVSRFVFISTPSIYFNYTDRFLISEQEPLPSRMVNEYAATKLKAERLVLAANSDILETVALRPRAIIGAEDTVIFPRVLKAYQENKLVIIGSGTNKGDITCVRNVIEAIVCSLNAQKQVMGQAYNVSNDEPVVLWEVLNNLLQQLGLKPVTRKLPYWIVMTAAWITEQRYKWFKPNEEPPITQHGIGSLARSMTMDISLAKKNLGYKPVQSTQEGINEFIEWYKSQKTV